MLAGKYKPLSTVKSLGCSPEELKNHLEKLFYPHPKTGEPMSWSNRGSRGWHVDHIISLAKFDLTDPEQFKKACNYKNLQPLWQEDHALKTIKDIKEMKTQDNL
jgi:hypothetical protein